MGATTRDRHTWVIAIVIMWFCIPSYSLAQVTFERTFGGSGDDGGNSVKQTQDGGYVVAGATTSFGVGNGDAYLIRTDSLGDTLWTKTYGGINGETAESVQQTQDGGFVLVGTTDSFGAGRHDAYMLRTDFKGNVIWWKTFGGIEWDYGHAVQQSQDGGYVVVGETFSPDFPRVHVYSVKTDSLGDTLWTRTYGESRADRGYSVQQTDDGGYVIAGVTSSASTNSADVYLIRTDSAGDTIWTRTYDGGFDHDFGYSVQQTTDLGFIVAGRAATRSDGYDVFLVRTDSLGDTLWTRTYGSSDGDAGNSVQQTPDGGYIVVGNTAFLGGGAYLIRTDSLGDSLWSKIYNPNDGTSGESVQLTSDGGFVVTGWTYYFGVGSYDVYLIKTDGNGLTGVEEVGAELPMSRRGYELFQSSPNPFRRSTSISYSLPTATEVTLTIYDITGRLVETVVNEIQQPGIHQVRWDRKQNPSGVYFCRLRALEFVETRKMVVVE